MHAHARHLRSATVLIAALATALAGSMVAVPAAIAAEGPVTFTVDSAADEPDAADDGDCATSSGACTLRAAFQEADAYDSSAVTIEVPAELGPYVLTEGELYLSDANKSADATYRVVGTGGRAVIDADGQSRVMGVEDDHESARLDVTLTSIELTGGHLDMEITSLAESDNRRDGGGLYVMGGSFEGTTVLLDDVVVQGNEIVGGYGAGVANYVADMTVRGSVVRDNRALPGEWSPSYGGGIYTGSPIEPGSVLTLQHTDVIRNVAAEGGGVWAGPEDVVTVMGGGFVENIAIEVSQEYQLREATPSNHEFRPAGVGGAIYGDESQIDISGTLFQGNAAGESGGAIFTGYESDEYDEYAGSRALDLDADEHDAVAPSVVVAGSVVTIDGATFTGNGEATEEDMTLRTTTGGAIQARQGDVYDITDSTFDANVASFLGGAIETGHSTLSVTGSTFADNHIVCAEQVVTAMAAGDVAACESGGGAISAYGPQLAYTLYITSSSFVGNSAAYGGALLNSDLAYLTNVTIADNRAYDGGAVYNMGEVHLTRSTIAGNSATDPESVGGLMEIGDDTTYLDHTVFAENTADGVLRNCAVDYGQIISEGHNVADDATCFDVGEATGDQAGVDVVLGTLDTSGPTAVVPLMPTSPAIDVDTDSGTCPTATDDADTDAHADQVDRDQRGAPAPVDGDGDGTFGCDAGAFEFQTNVVRVTGTTAGREAGSTAGAVAFARDGDMHAPLTATLAFGGTAVAGADYTAPAAAVTFPAGQATATTTIPVMDDQVVEPTETVVATVVDRAGYVVGAPAVGTVDILDDDQDPTEGQVPPPTVGSTRLAGDDRIDTAVLSSEFSFPDGADTVVIARSDLYADALAGGPLAHDLEAPILVTPSHSLDERVRTEIARLGASEAVVLGGPQAIAAAVEDALRDQAGLVTTRIAGSTRFETAVGVAEQLGGQTVYVTEGDNPDPNRGWPDAVAVSSLAAHQARPIVFVTTDTLPEVTRTHLQGMDAAAIVGGPAAVSVAVEEAIDAATTVTGRIEGQTRYATAAAVADAAMAAGLTPDTLWVSRGDNWVDALVAGPAVARAGDVFLLVPPTDLARAPEIQDWITSHGDVIEQFRIMGGDSAVSAVVEQQLLRLLNP